MASNATYICIPCHLANKSGGICTTCKGQMRYMGKRWRAPKRTNTSAWKLIEKGIAFWDKRYRESQIKRSPGSYRDSRGVPNKNKKGTRRYEYTYDMEGRRLIDLRPKL